VEAPTADYQYKGEELPVVEKKSGTSRRNRPFDGGVGKRTAFTTKKGQKKEASKTLPKKGPNLIENR